MSEPNEMTPEGPENVNQEPSPAAETPAEGSPPQAGTADKAAPSAIRDERIERLRRRQQKQGPVQHLKQDPTFFPKLSPRDIDQELEKELQEAMGGLSEQQMVDEMLSQRQKAGPAPTSRKKGKIISVHGGDVFIDVPGARSQGVLPISQFPEGKPDPGSEVEVEIEGYDAANGLLVLTRKGAAVDADWSTVTAGMVVEARVVETNKGGLAVSVNGIRGFMPISQIDLYRVENTEQFVNERFRCVVTEVNPELRDLVVSRRALLEQEREEQREKIWQELSEGQVREGVVRKVENFGAFVDLGGVDGLLHVSEMSWQRVRHPEDLVKPGERLKVIILKIDRERRRIGLGLKQLQASPWDDVEEKYPPGRVVTGKVTRLADFGAFVELEPAIEGLIHISELASHRVHRVADIVQIGQEIAVQVLSVDRERRKISLSLKAVQAQQAEAVDTEEEEVEEIEVRPARPRTTPLRGGVGNQQWQIIPGNPPTDADPSSS